jgi:hypothetical protein
MKSNFATLIIAFVLLSSISCAALWGTAYFAEVLSCGWVPANCPTDWAVLPLVTTGIAIMIIPVLVMVAFAQSQIDSDEKS